MESPDEVWPGNPGPGMMRPELMVDLVADNADIITFWCPRCRDGAPGDFVRFPSVLLRSSIYSIFPHIPPDMSRSDFGPLLAGPCPACAWPHGFHPPINDGVPNAWEGGRVNRAGERLDRFLGGSDSPHECDEY